MSERERDLLSTRTVAIRLPSGDTEYWLTHQVFSVGDAVRCQGRDWIVVKSFDLFRADDHHTVTLGEPPSVPLTSLPDVGRRAQQLTSSTATRHTPGHE